MTNKPKIILHIGRHKSGTSSLQRFLYENTESLMEYGYFYSKKNTNGKLAHHDFAEILRPINNKGLTDDEIINKNSELINNFIGNLDKTKINIISSESFQNIKPRILKKIFKDFDITVICYIRNELDYLSSAYSQKVQATNYSKNIKEYINDLKLNYYKFFLEWRKEFDCFKIFPFERKLLVKNSVIHDFLTKSLNINDHSNFTISNIDQNPSVSEELMWIKLRLNRNYHIPENPKLYSHLAKLSLNDKKKYKIPKGLAKELIQKKLVLSEKEQIEMFGFKVFDYNEILKSESFNKETLPPNHQEDLYNNIINKFGLRSKENHSKVIDSIKKINNLVEKNFYKKAKDELIEVNKEKLKPNEKEKLLKSLKIKRISTLKNKIPTININTKEKDSNQNDIYNGKITSHQKYIINKYSEKEVVYKKPKNGNQHYIYKENKFTIPKTDIIEIDNGYISIDFNKSYKFDYYFFNQNHELISEVSHGESPFLLREGVYNYEKNIAFIEDRFTKFNICHLISDKIPRYFEFIDSELDFDEVIVFSNNKYVDDLLHTLKITKTNLDLFEGNRVTIKLKKIFISSSSSYDKSHPAQLGYEQFNKTIDKIIESTGVSSLSINSPKRIFIDRSNGKTRNIINSEDFRKTLSRFGFESVFLEKLSFIEQVNLFYNSDFVIGVHGAGLTNASFCKPGTKVIEILPPLCATKSFWIPLSLRKIDYDAHIAIDEKKQSVSDYQNWRHEPKKYNRNNIYVNCQEFEKLLREKI